MAMNLIILLAVTSVYSTNESFDEFQPYFNLTLNGTFERTPDWNVTDDPDDEETVLGGTSSNGRLSLSFWEAWEARNGSFLESFEFISPSPSKAMAVTEASPLDVLTTSSTGDGDKMTSPTPVPSEVTSYSQEDQLNKPITDIWPVKLAAEIPGDLIIGGLMMVHEREDTITCGPIMPQGGIQAVETMLYTLDTVNKGLDNFRIGVHILDDCDKDTYGLEMAVDFIKGMFAIRFNIPRRRKIPYGRFEIHLYFSEHHPTNNENQVKLVNGWFAMFDGGVLTLVIVPSSLDEGNIRYRNLVEEGVFLLLDPTPNHY